MAEKPTQTFRSFEDAREAMMSKVPGITDTSIGAQPNELEALGLTLVQVSPKDAVELLAFEQKVGSKTYPPDKTIEEAEEHINRFNVFYFIRKEGVTIGTMAYSVRDEKTVYIGSFAFDPQHRRSDIALAAIRHLLRMHKDAARIEVWVHTENTPTLTICRALGFQKGEIKESWTGDGKMYQVLYRDKLP